MPGRSLKAIATVGVQSAFTRSFVSAAGPLDESWRQTAVRSRLADHNLLPEEAARLKRLMPSVAP